MLASGRAAGTTSGACIRWRGTLRESKFLWAFCCVRRRQFGTSARPGQTRRSRCPPQPQVGRRTASSRRRWGSAGGSPSRPVATEVPIPLGPLTDRTAAVRAVLHRAVDAVWMPRTNFARRSRNSWIRPFQQPGAGPYCSSCPKGPQTIGAPTGGNTGTAPGACSGQRAERRTSGGSFGRFVVPRAARPSRDGPGPTRRTWARVGALRLFLSPFGWIVIPHHRSEGRCRDIPSTSEAVERPRTSALPRSSEPGAGASPPTSPPGSTPR